MDDVIGRDAELESIRAFVSHGSGALVLEGEPGIGKSTIWLAGVEHAVANGARVLRSRPAEAERGLAYVGLSDLFDAVVDEVLPALAKPRRHALQVALLREDPAGGRIEPRALGIAIRDALELLAASRPLLIAIDDVQWFDDPSAHSLGFALRRLAPSRVAVLLARRAGTAYAGSVIERAIDSRQIAVGPLSIGATQKLLQTRLGRTLPRPILLRLHEASGGNPFYMLELARAGDRDAATTLDRLVGGRLRALSATTRASLLFVSVHGRPAIDLLPAEAVKEALAAGVVEQVAGTVRFTHPLLGSAVYESASPEHRRDAHRAVAATVDEPISRARHLGLSADQPDAAISMVLAEAAATAGMRGATLVAAELADLAVRLTPREQRDDLHRRVLLQADLLCDAGDGLRAVALLEAAARTATPGRDRTAILVALARAECAFVGTREGIARYQEALAEIEDDDALLAEVHLGLADHLRDTADARHALDHAELAVASAARSGDPALRCQALAAHSQLHSRLGLGILHEETREALELERSLPIARATNVATETYIYQLLWSGELSAARDVIAGWRSRLAETGDRGEEIALWYAAMVEWRAGRWDSARAHANAVLTLREEFGIQGSQGIAELPAGMVAAYRGEVEEARERSIRALDRAEADGIFIAQSAHRAVLGFIELSLGNPAKALEFLRRGWEIRDLSMILEPGHRWELGDTLEALIAVGLLDEAEEKLAVWEERARVLDRSWALAITARCRALALAARGDLAGAQEHFERALREHDRTDDPFQLARTLLAQGRTHRRAMRRAAARHSLERALQIFEQLGSPQWAANARSELKRIGGRAPGRDDLTESERRVAALVAEGMTNQEVAAALFLGERTVASHLTHIYAKMRVRSRTELARRLQ